MKTVTTFIALIIALSTLSAQSPVKKDLMKTLESIPPPPATVKDAFAKIGADCGAGSSECSAEKLFKSVEQEIKDFDAEFLAQPKAGPGSVAPGSPSANMTKEEKAEMKKKMKNMTKEEKMQMAMEMSKNMPAGGGSAAVMDPPPIRAALDEWQKIYSNTTAEYQRGVALQQEEIRLNDEHQKSHDEITKWEESEIEKLPQISSGEMSAPDPVKVKAVKLKAADKHIAAANKWLEQVTTRWRASVSYSKNKWGKFYEKLIAADYAADSKNFSTKKTLSDAQMMLFTDIQTQIKQSRNAWEESAGWQARRKEIEEMKVN